MQTARRRWLATAGLSTLASALPPALAGDAAPSQQAAGQPVTLPDSEAFSLHNAAGHEYRIFVAAPPGAPPPQGYGVQVVLDGNAYFAAAAQAMRMLQAFPEFVHEGKKMQARPTLVVGVGYPGDGVLDGPRRSWDFLPPARNRKHVERLRGGEPGGADAFVDFLTRTLRPALAARHPLADDRHTLTGHSLGGYFVLHALAREPAAFQRYAALSPSTWWDDLRLAADVARAEPGDARIMLAVAQDEWPGHPGHSLAMLGGARAVRDALDSLPLAQGALQYQEAPGQDHMTMPFALTPAVARFAALP